jgi:hypothetical protein
LSRRSLNHRAKLQGAEPLGVALRVLGHGCLSHRAFSHGELNRRALNHKALNRRALSCMALKTELRYGLKSKVECKK